MGYQRMGDGLCWLTVRGKGNNIAEKRGSLKWPEMVTQFMDGPGKEFGLKQSERNEILECVSLRRAARCAKAPPKAVPLQQDERGVNSREGWLPLASCLLTALRH